MSDTALQVFTGNAHPELAQKIVDCLGISLSKAKVSKFQDGEVRLEINESVRGNNVFIVQPTCRSFYDGANGPQNLTVNENLMELLIMIDAIRRASAKSITTVIPYYGYARQERKQKPREPISAKLIANLLTAAGADRMVTIDLHTSSIQGFFDIPVDHMPAAPLLAEYYQKKNLENVIVVSPDIGGVTRARNIAEQLNCGLAIIDKRRPEPNQSEIMGIIGNVKGKNVIIVDDMIDTAGTITNAAKYLAYEAGAKEVYACCTHAVFTNPAIQRIEDSPIKEMLITDTLPMSPEERQCSKIQTVSIAPLLGRTIEYIHNKKSVSEIFEQGVIKNKE